MKLNGTTCEIEVRVGKLAGKSKVQTGKPNLSQCIPRLWPNGWFY